MRISTKRFEEEKTLSVKNTEHVETERGKLLTDNSEVKALPEILEESKFSMEF